MTTWGRSDQASAPTAKIAPDHEEQQHGGDLEHLRPLQGDVDHRRQGQDQPDHDQHADRDVPRRAAEDVGGQGRAAGRPARPQVGEVGQDREEQAPVPPVAAEPGQRGLAGGQGVALDLQVDEVLGDQPDERGPDEDQPDLGGDEGEEDELTRGQPDAGGDDARGRSACGRRSVPRGRSRTSGRGRFLVGNASAAERSARSVVASSLTAIPQSARSPLILPTLSLSQTADRLRG